MPILADGVVVGGVGISGAGPAQTDPCVQAGLDAIADQLQ